MYWFLFCYDQYRLICGTCELVDGWEIAKSSPAKVFLNEEVLRAKTSDNNIPFIGS